MNIGASQTNGWNIGANQLDVSEEVVSDINRIIGIYYRILLMGEDS